MDSRSSLERLLNIWQSQKEVADNVVDWHITPQRVAEWADFPDSLHPAVVSALKSNGYFQLYSHQAQAVRAALNGEHFVAVTGTASGKTLCYNLPVLDALARQPNLRALYIFPTKALTQDQLNGLQRLSAPMDPRPPAAIYDGDTPTAARPKVRAQARILLSNPDMVHISILPHHTLWADFFRNLRFIVIDEIHTYRGIFGSHLANLVRRIQRVAAFYGAFPQFFMTSATIGNPKDLAERIIEAPVTVVDRDGSPHGKQHMLLVNPPIVNAELGIRRGASSEAIRLTGDLLAYQVQAILFTKARRSVEIMLRTLREKEAGRANQIRGYRSGYLARERREIEQELRSGQARAVVATNALELGIDIGSLDAAIMVGYPGTIAATRQQAGRAGRRNDSSLAVMVASASPLDQFLMKHPDYIFERSPEHALIDPDNLLILLGHLRCAAFELPFKIGEGFGRVSKELFEGLMEVLVQSGELHLSQQKYFWTADQYPANNISLRTTGESPVVLQALVEDRPQVIGQVDDASARWMVHPGAIYLHEGLQYEVSELDLERSLAVMSPVNVDYYTEAMQNVTIELISLVKKDPVPGGEKHFGEILVTSQVTGFKRIRWGTMEILGQQPLEMPPTTLRTMAYWLSLNDQTQDRLRSLGQWNSDVNDYGPNWNRMRNLARQRDRNTCQVCGKVEQGQAHHVHHKRPFRSFTSFMEANQLENLITLCSSCHKQAEEAVRVRTGLGGLAYELNHLAPLFLMCDISDIGCSADPQSDLSDGQPTVILYDLVPAGIGLSDRLYQVHDTLMKNALELVASCECLEGCPSCVGPGGENGAGGKAEAVAILKELSPQ